MVLTHYSRALLLCHDSHVLMVLNYLQLVRCLLQQAFKNIQLPELQGWKQLRVKKSHSRQK